ncbi:carboxypeptidase-like regulatory domain-containing protein [Maribellus comscasis]|uniref:Carboxypeptidase-like regulatory domain-containing protein n=1 Tax=Maribellus comscasis TaxID=2681766 RepID=A0A6I6K1E0_9BACT|nr:carboxypeptidase-like regulatory domain-containing protein [Maribellus comscasis]QGY43744.1 carboxypeptidase-like regulatory domain-containing protein [Maribellus comscasis]
MKSLVVIILSSFLALSVSADDGNKVESVSRENNSIYFTGTVKDKETGEYLVGAEVEIEGTELKTYTDFDGNFSFDNIAPGNYNVSANYISYKSEKLENLEISSRTNMLELELQQTK